LFIAFYAVNSGSEYILNIDFQIFTFSFLTKVVIPVFVVLLLLNSKEVLVDFIKSIKILGIFYIIYFLLKTNNLQNVDFGDRFTFAEASDNDTISVSRVAALIFLFSFLMIKANESVIIHTGLLISSGFLLLVTGQRGTLIGTVGALICFFVINKHPGKQITKIFVFLVPILFFLQTLNFSQFEVFNRFTELEDYRETERYEDYSQVATIFESNSFFYGGGSMSYYFLTGRDYPHNLLLEAIADYGLIGLLCVIMLVIFGLRYSLFILKEGDIYSKVIALIWFMLLCSVLVSGSFVSNFQFFCFSAVLAITFNFSTTPEEIQKFNKRALD
jgi:hypothetical protein